MAPRGLTMVPVELTMARRRFGEKGPGLAKVTSGVRVNPIPGITRRGIGPKQPVSGGKKPASAGWTETGRNRRNRWNSGFQGRNSAFDHGSGRFDHGSRDRAGGGLPPRRGTAAPRTRGDAGRTTGGPGGTRRSPGRRSGRRQFSSEATRTAGTPRLATRSLNGVRCSDMAASRSAWMASRPGFRSSKRS